MKYHIYLPSFSPYGDSILTCHRDQVFFRRFRRETLALHPVQLCRSDSKILAFQEMKKKMFSLSNILSCFEAFVATIRGKTEQYCCYYEWRLTERHAGKIYVQYASIMQVCLAHVHAAQSHHSHAQIDCTY